jgi:hypothetical protein
LSLDRSEMRRFTGPPLGGTAPPDATLST